MFGLKVGIKYTLNHVSIDSVIKSIFVFKDRCGIFCCWLSGWRKVGSELKSSFWTVTFSCFNTLEIFFQVFL